MQSSDEHRLPADVEWVAERLERDRPIATSLEMDRVKTRAMSRAAGSRTPLKGSILKTRLAITMMLVAGLLVSGTGATLAISGPSDSGASASQAYPDQGRGGNAGNESVAGEELAAQAPAQESQAEAAESARPAQQTAAAGSGSSLPFTGLAAIPVLLVGLALLSTGMVLGRKAHNERS